MKNRNHTIPAFVAAISVVFMGVARAAAAKKADIVFKNAVIHTMDEANPTAEAVAITGDTKTYVLLTMMDGRITFAEPSVLAGPLSHLDVGYDWQE